MDDRSLLGHLERKAAWLRRFDEAANDVTQRLKQTSTLVEESLKDVLEEAQARPMASVLAEVQEAAKKEVSTLSVGSAEDECHSQKPCTNPYDEAITYWNCMCVMLAQRLKETRCPENTHGSVRPGKTRSPSLADFQKKLSSYESDLSDQIECQTSSLQSLEQQLSSLKQNIDNLDRLILQLTTKNVQLADEIAEGQKHIKQKRSKELHHLKQEIACAGDSVKRQTKQVRSMLANYEPSQAPSGAVENGHGDSDVYVNPLSLHRETSLRDAYCQLQQTSLTGATDTLQKKSGAVARATKVIMDQSESFKAADVRTSVSLSQGALKDLNSQKQIWKLVGEKVQGKTFAEWLEKANLEII